MAIQNPSKYFLAIQCLLIHVILRVVVFYLLSTTGAIAQVGLASGEIRGRVVDASAAVVPNVSVNATNQNTGIAYSIQTSTSGEYRIRSLSPDIYEVSVTASGFRQQVKKPVPVLVGQTSIVDFELQIGPAEGLVVDVTATLPIAESDRSQQS